ncbi:MULTISPECIES: transposase [Acidithrix]|uniref:transposase n=1 Tax=Acidithrix TaxID=1609233 RepID=UPI0006991E7A|nr:MULTISPECIES: transposase [Acidithrix]
MIATNPPTAATLLDKTIADCLVEEVPEIVTLDRTLLGWRTEILNHHLTGASNCPTEGLNLLIK